MNDIIDDTQSTYRQWTLELTAALSLAGFGVNSRTGDSNYCLGWLTVTKPGTEDIKYIIELERKMLVTRKGTEATGGAKLVRRQITQLEVYNPIGGLHVHIRNFSPEAVAKVVSYAKQTIERKVIQQVQNMARNRRNKEGSEIMHKGTEGFIIPDWVRIQPNVEKDEEVGTFRVLFTDQTMDWPLARLSIAKAKAVIDAIRAVTCDHKFVDSLTCRKCGWAPPVSIHATPPVNVWHAGSEPVPPELVNDPGSIVVPAPDGGVLLKEFRVEGSTGTVKPLYWMPLPKRPELKG